MLDGVIVPVQQMVYSILYFVAETLWGINQAILLVGYYVMSITSWMSQQMFQPLLTSIGNSTDSLLLPVFTLAMLTLGISYLLGVFGVVRVVEFKSAVIWCAVAVMWFQFGPELYLGFEQFRRDLSGGFYGTVFTDVTGAGGTIEGMGQIGDAGDMQIDPPTNNFGAFLSFDTSIDGLDIALAYLDADGCDVLRTAGCLFQPMPDGNNGSMPLMWYQADGAFDINQHSFFYGFGMTQDERQQSLDDAARGIWIAFSGIVVSLFGLLEQIIQLLLTLAFGIAFASFFIAILFAFFKKTESVTWAVFDIILGLFIQSIITSLLLALVMAFVSVAGATGNGILLLGVGFLGIILIAILLIGAVQAILGALNGLMGAFGNATGGNLNAAGSVTRVASAYATGGATLMSGGSLAQTAGALMGPGAAQKAYYASRAFGSDTYLGRAANDVAQGATASYLGPVGGYALGRAGTNETASPAELAGNTITGARNTIANMTLGTPIRTQDNPPPLGPNLSARAADGAEIRRDPLTAQPYAFSEQANGQGLRTYEDGSRLSTSLDDEPLSRDRAREESKARRRASSDEGELSDASVARIDASDDDENAALLAAVRSGNDNRTDTTQMNTPTVTLNNSDASSLETPITASPPSVNGMTSPVGQPSPTEAFLMEVELANPGATGREDLIAQYFPDGASPQAPQTTEIAIVADDVRLDVTTDAVTNVPQVGEATQERLAGAGIRTAGELANASVNDLASVGIGDRRAEFLIGQAQSYVGAPSASSDETEVVQNSTLSGGEAVSADRLAAANDAVNNDDAVRLANGVGVAVRNALSGGGTPTAAQTAQITAQAGLPDMPQATQFVQVASAMGLSGQQAQAVIQDVQQNNALGSEISGAIRSSLSNLTLSNGTQLDSAGMDQAVGLLEGAARSLVTAANTLNNGSGNTEAGDAATAGSTRPQTSANT
jgi:predicted flap endonuclease-1-like 5' DNA nuclease